MMRHAEERRAELARLRTPARAVSALALTLTLAGCMSFGGGSGTVTPLPATPTQPVASTSLPAPTTLDDATNATGELTTLDDVSGVAADGALETASVDGASAPSAPQSSPEVSQDDLIGVWSASTPLATCSINLSLTTWTGGFRGSTRNCGDPQLSTLQAWSVEGRQVFLKDGEGNTLARLFKTADTRYAGQFETGQAVTVFR